MRQTRRYDHDSLRRSNRALVFAAIESGGESSRFDLSKKTGISPATVGAIIEDLLAEGLVQEIRVGLSTGGRRPVLVDLRPEGRFVLSGRLTVRGAEFALIDLAGRLVASHREDETVSGNAAARELLLRGAGVLLAAGRIDPALLAGQAISVPGMVNAATGLVLHSPPLRLDSFDLPGVMAELSGKPSSVHKDTDALLLAECARGAARGFRNVVYIWVKEGVGMSYLHEGEVLVLPRGGFELGHTAWIRGGIVCHCGTPGCIGTELSEAHAGALFRTETGEGERTYAELCGLAELGEARALGVLEHQIEILGTVVANVVNLLNPEMIVLGGPLSAAPGALRERLRRLARDRSLPPFKASVRLEYSRLAPEEVLSSMGVDFFRKHLFPDH